MTVRSQDGEKITDTKSTLILIKRNKEGRFNVLGLKDGIRFVMGTYGTEKTAHDVMSMIWDCVLQGMEAFEMPEDLEG